MSVAMACVLLVGCWALVRFVLTPRIERCKPTRRRWVVARAAALAATQTAAVLALVGGAVYGLLAVALLYCDWFAKAGTARELGAAVFWLRGWKEFLEATATWWGWAVTWSAAITLILLWINMGSARRRARRAHEAAFKFELDRIVAEINAVAFDPRAAVVPYPDCQAIQNALVDADVRLEKHAQNPLSSPGHEEWGIELRRHIQSLEAKLVETYLKHRMEAALPQIEQDAAKRYFELEADAARQERLGRVRRLLLWPRLRNARSEISNWLTIASAVMFFLALLTAAATSRRVHDAVDMRIADGRQLQVQLARAEVDAQWAEKEQASAAQTAPNKSDADADERALNVLSRQFEEASIHSPRWSPPPQPPHCPVTPRPPHTLVLDNRPVTDFAPSPRSEDLRRAAVRQRLLKRLKPAGEVEIAPFGAAQTEVAFPVADVGAPPAEPTTSGGEIERQMAEVITRTEPAADGPRTALGRSYRQWLNTNVADKHDARWGKLVEVSRSLPPTSFANTPPDVVRTLWTESLGLALGGVDQMPPAAQQAAQIMIDATGNALHSWFETSAKSFTRGLLDGKSIEQAAAQITGYDPDSPTLDVEKLAKFDQWYKAQATNDAVLTKLDLDPHPPALTVRGPPQGSRQVIEQSLEKWKAFNTAQKIAFNAGRATESLLAMEDCFPGQSGADVLSYRSSVQNKFSDSAIGEAQLANQKVLPDAQQNAEKGEASERAFKVARDFSLLDGYTRVGGVLIGRPADDVSDPQIVGLRWNPDGANALRLELIKADGASIALGRPFQRSMIRQALTYAADGRPMAATIINVHPIEVHKVIVHPALIDTPLGQSAIDLDKFIFEQVFPRKGGGGSTKRAKAAADFSERTTRARGEVELYRFAWLARLERARYGKELQPLFERSTNGQVITAAQRYDLEDLRADRKAARLAEIALRGAAIAEPDSPLLDAELFDQKLVGELRAYAGKSLKELQQYLAEKSLSGIRDAYELGGLGAVEGLVTSWLMPPPQSEIVSGVRDGAYSVDAELSALKLPPRAEPLKDLAPLTFVVQMAFADDSRRDVEPSSRPWRFGKETDQIVPVLQAWLDTPSNADGRAVFEDMREFTVLQRLFRLAFSGGLGASFPIEQLESLADVVRDATASAATPRWDGDSQLENTFAFELGEEQEVLKVLLSKAQPADDAERVFYDQATKAIAEAVEVLGRADPQELSAAEWEAKCSLRELLSAPAGLYEKVQQLGSSEQRRHPALLIQVIARKATQVAEARALRAVVMR